MNKKLPGMLAPNEIPDFTPEREQHLKEQSFLPESQQSIKVDDKVVIVSTGEKGTIWQHAANGDFVVRISLGNNSFMLKNFKAEEIEKD